MDRWYSFNFNISWDKNEKQKTWVDIFIIDTIVREVISQKKSEIDLWRIHRRWYPDETGHELTFDCFTNEEDVRGIEESIRNNIEFKKLQESNLLTNGKELKIDPQDIDKITEKIPEQLKEP